MRHIIPALRWAGMVALVVLVGSCSLFDYSSIVSKKYALVYGVTRYTMGVSAVTSPNLSYPDADAQSMAALLSSAGYTIEKARWIESSGNVYYLDPTHTTKQASGSIGTPTTSDDGVTVTDPALTSADAPTKANILADMKALSTVVGQNDVVVVYFSGHGTQNPYTSPTREYFDPYQGVAYYSTYSKYYEADVTSIQDDELGTYFSALPTSRKVLILDTCNSGGFIGNSLEADATTQTVVDSTTGTVSTVTVSGVDVLAKAIANYASFTSSSTGLSPYNAQVLSAAGKDESSYETSGLGHGVMTYYLLKTAAGADLNSDGKVTVLEAFAYVKAAIDSGWNASTSVIAAGETFEPHVSGGPVDFVLF